MHRQAMFSTGKAYRNAKKENATAALTFVYAYDLTASILLYAYEIMKNFCVENRVLKFSTITLQYKAFLTSMCKAC